MRRLLMVVGVAAAIFGFVMLFVPELVVFGSRSVLAVLAAVSLLQAGRVVRDRLRTDHQFEETPDPETEQDLAVPGDDFDETLRELRERPPQAAVAVRSTASRRYRGRGTHQREAVTERLETAAVNALVRRHGWSRERAREAVGDGEWTDDPYAAAFFTGDLSGLSLRERLRRVLSSERSFQRQAKAAADAVARVADTDAESVGPSREGESA